MAGLNPIVVLDFALRAGAGVVLLLLAGLLLRDHGKAWSARLGALFALGAAVFAASSFGGVGATAGSWRAPGLAVSSGDAVVFWLFARAMFDEDFRPRLWQAGLWAAVIAAAMTCALWLRPNQSPWADRIDTGLAIVSLAFAGLAVLQTLSSWSADLVEPRRRLRVAIVAASASYIALTTLSGLFGPQRLGAETVSLTQAVGLAAIAGAIAWGLIGVAGGEALFVTPQAVARPPAPEVELEPADRALLSALDRAMGFDRLYRREGLTIGELAHRLGTAEYRLRRLINQGLGGRNFNRYLNSYRIADARGALADAGQAEVPILTIALDAGFNSLGPFNRAFKDATGLTPSDYRQRARSGADELQPVSISAGRISKSA